MGVPQAKGQVQRPWKSSAHLARKVPKVPAPTESSLQHEAGTRKRTRKRCGACGWDALGGGEHLGGLAYLAWCGGPTRPEALAWPPVRPRGKGPCGSYEVCAPKSKSESKIQGRGQSGCMSQGGSIQESESESKIQGWGQSGCVGRGGSIQIQIRIQDPRMGSTPSRLGISRRPRTAGIPLLVPKPSNSKDQGAVRMPMRSQVACALKTPH